MAIAISEEICPFPAYKEQHQVNIKAHFLGLAQKPDRSNTWYKIICLPLEFVENAGGGGAGGGGVISSGGDGGGGGGEAKVQKGYVSNLILQLGLLTLPPSFPLQH